MKGDSVFSPQFSIDCYDGEVVDDYGRRFRYRIAVAAHGVDAHCRVYRPVIEGSILRDAQTDQYHVDRDRPLIHPPFMAEGDARAVLLAAFRHLDLCRGYEDGFVISMPVVLHEWTHEHLPTPLAQDVERMLLAAVIFENATLN
jgi:hypothetical protein